MAEEHFFFFTGCVVFFRTDRMFLQTLRRGFTARNMRTIRPITVDASALSQTEVPHEQAFTWVQYFSHLGEPSDITVIDGTLLETDELDALARQEEGTNDSRAILAASKRTLTYDTLSSIFVTV